MYSKPFEQHRLMDKQCKMLYINKIKLGYRCYVSSFAIYNTYCLWVKDDW